MTRIVPLRTGGGGGNVGKPTPASFVEAGGVLGAAIRAIRRDVNIHPIAPETQQGAWQQIHAIEPLLVAPDRDVMIAWLVKLAAAVANAPNDRHEIVARSEAIWETCSDLPAGVWCDATRLGWIRTLPAGRFWPTAGELYAHLEAFAQAMRREKAACERILQEAGKMPEKVVKPDSAEKEAVTHMLQAWRVEQGDRHRADEAAGKPDVPIVTPRHLSDEHLLAVYEQGAAEGHAPSAFRAEHLRAKLGAARDAQDPGP